jgi:hypothetical protein
MGRKLIGSCTGINREMRIKEGGNMLKRGTEAFSTVRRVYNVIFQLDTCVCVNWPPVPNYLPISRISIPMVEVTEHLSSRPCMHYCL